MKILEVFQNMIEGTQALLEKQLEKQRSIEDQIKSQLERGQVPSGSRNLISSDGVIIEGPQKTNKRRGRRANTHRKTESPPPQEVMESKVEPEMVVPNSVLEEKEETGMKSLWDEIQEANVNREGKGKAPIAGKGAIKFGYCFKISRKGANHFEIK